MGPPEVSPVTGRERLRAAYRGETVDRLPWAPIVTGTTMRDFPPDLRERGPHGFIADLGGDVLCREGAPYRTLTEDVHATTQTLGERYTVERRTPVGTLTEVYQQTSSGQWHHIEWPIKSLDDLRTYRFIREHTRHEPDPTEHDRLAAEIGEAGIIAPHVAATPVQELLQVGMGVEKFVLALQDDRAEVEDLMALMHARNMESYDIVAASAVEVAILCENTSTRMISPALYERYSLGHARDFVETMHRRGKVAVVHMCGHIRGLLPLIARTGLDAIDALTPPPTGDTTPHDAWQAIGRHLVVHAVWDPTRWLTCPEPDLERNLLDTLEGVRGRRYVLCSAADGLAGIPVERFEAVARLVHRHAQPWQGTGDGSTEASQSDRPAGGGIGVPLVEIQ
jgi:hypothetical protein